MLKNILDLEKVDIVPKEVVMVELDDLVMEACAKHMRSVCGNYLDPENRYIFNFLSNVILYKNLRFIINHFLIPSKGRHQLFSIDPRCSQVHGSED